MTPLIEVTIDGQDVASRVAARTVSCRITETDGGRADELILVVSNHDGRLRKPRGGAIVEVALGFREKPSASCRPRSASRPTASSACSRWRRRPA